MSNEVPAIHSFGGPFLENAPKVKTSANFISRDCPELNRENKLRQRPLKRYRKIKHELNL
jgi:hypothetical protein